MVQKLLQVILQEITKSLSIVYAFLCELWVAIFFVYIIGNRSAICGEQCALEFAGDKGGGHAVG